MTTATSPNPIDPCPDAFGDPVAYLASFGIESELVVVTSLPAAA